jgi:hypothetical protein
MAGYANKTEVSVEKSRAEIERTLERFGANQFNYAHDHERGMAMIQFRARDRMIRFILTLPDRNAKAYTKMKNGWTDRTADAAYKLWEQACRSKWRALALCIKAKLAAVEAGITEFEDEFLAHTVLPNDRTAGEWLKPQIAQAYLTEEMPRSLLALPAPTA